MIRKFSVCFAALALIAASITGCAKKAVHDNYGIYSDLDATLKAAQKSDKKILLFFTRVDQGGLNASLINDVLHARDYAEKIGAEFETCNIDFSGERFTKESKNFDKSQNDRDMRTAVIYGAENTPAALVLTPKGYVITNITYLPAKNVSEFSEILEYERKKIDAMTFMLNDIESAKGTDRIKKIDALYEKTATNYRYQLRDLCEEIIKSDKKNESGLVGKYLLARASTKAMDCYINRQPEKAVDAYLEPVKSEFLSVEDKQRSYFAAAYITGNGMPGAETSEKIIGYLNAAIALDATTPLAERCKLLLERQESMLKSQQDTEAKKEAEAAGEPATDTKTN